MAEQGPDCRNQIVIRSLAIWMRITCSEIINSIVRVFVFEPIVGEVRSNQLGPFNISAIIILCLLHHSVDWGKTSIRVADGQGNVADVDCGVRSPIWSHCLGLGPCIQPSDDLQLFSVGSTSFRYFMAITPAVVAPAKTPMAAGVRQIYNETG